jgi:hypothetical protein
MLKFYINYVFIEPETNRGSHPFPTEDYIEISDEEEAAGVLFCFYSL